MMFGCFRLALFDIPVIQSWLSYISGVLIIDCLFCAMYFQAYSNVKNYCHVIDCVEYLCVKYL